MLFDDPVCPFCGGDVDFTHAAESQGFGWCPDCEEMVQVESDGVEIEDLDSLDADPEFLSEFGDDFDNEEDF